MAPVGDGTRPTSDFVREAIFNVLQSLVDWDGLAVADLFAGSGALGIEALSRGASSCVFVDRDRRADACIRRNVQAVEAVVTTGPGAGPSASGADAVPVVEVVGADVVAWVARQARSFDVVFADPPYAFDDWASLAAVDARLLVAESDRTVDLGGAWRVLRNKVYGGTVVTLFEPQE